MDLQSALALGMPIGLGLAALGCGLGMGHAVASAMDATGRQPEASGKIMLHMIVGCAFVETITIYVFVFVFILLGKL